MPWLCTMAYDGVMERGRKRESCVGVWVCIRSWTPREQVSFFVVNTWDGSRSVVNRDADQGAALSWRDKYSDDYNDSYDRGKVG